MTLRLRDAASADLRAVCAIERVSFGDPWSRGMFNVHLSSAEGDVFLVADDSRGILGYAITRTVEGESELLNIAVTPDTRGQGVGARLLDAMIERSRESGGTEMWLEVRESNASARALYDSRGFVTVGVRKRYYDAPREDALVLRAALGIQRNETVTGPVLGFADGSVESILSPASHLPRQETK
jgi:ribosomal-protein-alanine N-acetyltransferase